MKSNESNYIHRLKKGKEDSLNYIVDRYLPLIKGIVSKVLASIGDEGDIEECINDVFISIWNNADKFDGDASNFKNWICAIAKFKAIDYYRNKKRKAEVILDSVDIIENDIMEDDSLEDKLINKENRNEIIEMLNNLDKVDRDIFILKYFLGYKTNEIAKKFGITKASVNNRLYRGKIKLKENMTNLKLEVI